MRRSYPCHDLQLIKAPLFRAIDICLQVLAMLPIELDGLRFRPENIRLDASIHATAQAKEFVVKTDSKGKPAI